MAVLYSNNATSTLSASITNSTTSFSVASGQGALFPSISGSDYFYATLSTAAGTVEIVKVTARSTDTFTVTRAQDGTSASAFSAGDKVELRIIKALLDDLKTDAVSGYVPLAGGTITGTLSLSLNQPRINFTETDGTAGYGQTALIRNSDIWNIQTRDSSGTFVSDDYLLTLGASGATQHEWRVANVAALTLSSTGVTVSGTGKRFLADFSNATITNRMAFQTSTANTSTSLGVLPNGTSSQSGMNFFNNSDPTNAGTLNLLANSTEASIRGGITGSGSYLPLTFHTGGSVRLTLSTAGVLTSGGVIESTSGGFKFPDGTTQTTASTGGSGGSGISTGKSIAMAMVFGG